VRAYPRKVPYSFNAVPIVSKQRILITGARGYLGQHLFQHLASDPRNDVHGTYRSSTQPLPNHHQLDLTNAAATTALLEELQPDQIYHTAGNLGGRQGAVDASTIWNDNLHATLHLYETCLNLKTMPRILFVSSGSIYGQHEGLINESTPLQPGSIYAASKAAADLASYTYWRSLGLPIIRARLFNYLGPLLPETTALGSFAHRIVRLEQLNQTPAILEVGNLAAERDYLTIHDVISAFTLLMEKGIPGDAYNVASGVSRPMQWYLDQLLTHAKLPITIQQDVSRMRASETIKLQVNISKLTDETGFQPRDEAETMLPCLLNSYRGQEQ
jgi:GDP-4-dehydro-6-deoxy-D-mannose reductase